MGIFAPGRVEIKAEQELGKPEERPAEDYFNAGSAVDSGALSGAMGAAAEGLPASIAAQLERAAELAAQEKLANNQAAKGGTSSQNYGSTAIMAEKVAAQKEKDEQDKRTRAQLLLELQRRLADAKARYEHHDEAYKDITNILDTYSDEDLQNGAHLENGKFRNEKTEEDWVRFCSEQNPPLDPNREDLRKDRTHLQNFQKWEEEQRQEAANDYDRLNQQIDELEQEGDILQQQLEAAVAKGQISGEELEILREELKNHDESIEALKEERNGSVIDNLLSAKESAERGEAIDIQDKRGDLADESNELNIEVDVEAELETFSLMSGAMEEADIKVLYDNLSTDAQDILKTMSEYEEMIKRFEEGTNENTTTEPSNNKSPETGESLVAVQKMEI